MADHSEVNEAPLMLKVLRELESMGNSRPKTWAKLAKVLTKSQEEIPVIVCSDPVLILEAHNLLSDKKVMATTFDPVPLKVDIKQFGVKAWNMGKGKALKANSAMIYAVPGSPQAAEIKKAVKNTLGKRPSCKHTTLGALMNSMFLQKNLTLDEIENHIVANLTLTGYIELDKHGKNVGVKYNLPSDFMFLCIKRLQSDYYDMYSRRLAEGVKIEDQMPLLIARINRHLTALKKLKASRTLQIQAQEKAVDVLVKSSQSTFLHKSKISFCDDDGDDELVDYDSEVADEWENEEKRRLCRSPLPRPGCIMGSTSLLPNRGGIKDHTGFYFFKDLCKKMSDLKVEDIKILHPSLLPESIGIIHLLEKMGPHKPKTLSALCNAIKPSCRFLYFTSLSHVLGKTENQLNPRRMFSRKRKRGNPLRMRKLDPTLVNIGSMRQKSTVTITPQQIFHKTKPQVVQKEFGSKKESRFPFKRARQETGARRVFSSGRVSRFSQRNQDVNSNPRGPISGTKEPRRQTRLDNQRQVLQEAEKFYAMLQKHIQYLARRTSSCIVLGDQEQRLAHFENVREWLKSLKVAQNEAASHGQRRKKRQEAPVSEEPMEVATEANSTASEAMEVDAASTKTTQRDDPTRKSIYESLIKCCVTLTKVKPEKIVELLKPMVEVKADGTIKYDIRPQDLENLETLANRAEASLKYDQDRLEQKCRLQSRLNYQ